MISYLAHDVSSWGRPIVGGPWAFYAPCPGLLGDTASPHASFCPPGLSTIKTVADALQTCFHTGALPPLPD